MWLRGDGGERGLQSLNFQSLGGGPWLQQRFEPLLLGNGHDQYQAMSAPALQDIRGADFLKQQFMHYQQPFQLPQQSCGASSISPQQIFQQTHQQQIINAQSLGMSENQTHTLQHQQLPHPHNEQQKQQLQHTQTYPETFLMPSNHMQQQQSHVSSQLYQKLVFPDSGTNLPSVLSPGCVQNMLGSAHPEGSAGILNFSRLGQPMMSEQNQRQWEPKFMTSQATPFGSSVLLPSFSEKDGSVETESCTADSQSHNLFGATVDSPSLLSNAMHNSIANVIDTSVSTMPYAASCIQNSLYGCLDESTGLLQNAGEVDPPTRTFVKVYKSGSVGRSLDISQFSNYEELREELGQMFGIEGQLEDRFRSGWQLVFVDRENDVLLLGDDPWEQFVNSVWYIKILSPEDVQKMGKQGV